MLLLFAFVCLTLAAIGITPARIHLGWAGVALFVLVSLIGAWPGS